MKSRNAMRFNIQVISVNLVFLILLFSTLECISQDIISLQISPQLNAQGDKWEPLLKSRQDNVTLVQFGPWFTTKVLSNSKQIAGNIRLMNDSIDCSFLLDYPAGGSSYPTGFLNIETDSCIVMILYAFVTKTTNDAANPEQVKKIISRGVAIFNLHEEQIAVLAFKALKNYKAKEAENFTQNDSLVISREIDKSPQMAIASLFAIIMGVDDKDQFFNY